MADISLEELRTQALSLGWDDMGVTAATIPEEDISAYREWLARGYQAGMGYMENQIRCTPQELLSGAQTAVIFVSYYKQERLSPGDGNPLVASYARGGDYHNIHRKRLKAFIRWLEQRSGLEGIARGFSDSKPILEKALAVQAGLGWFGKNSLLIHRRFGTFTLLSGILTTLSLPHTRSHLELRIPRCGSCTRCLDACPTQAFAAPYQLDTRKCLSYHLIESKEPIPEEIRRRNPGYIFGCDICQDVCPHNARRPLTTSEEFAPAKGVGPFLDKDKIEEILNHPEMLFGTPLKRKGAEGLYSNLHSLKSI